MDKFIKNKGVLLLIIIFILLFIFLICLGLNVLKQQAIDINTENLKILANEKAKQTNMFLESQKEKQSIIASMNVFKEAVKYPNDSAKIKIAKDRINELKDTIPGIAILTNNGIVVVAQSAPAGTDYKEHPYFLLEDKKIILTRYYDKYQKKDFYAIIGPIYDSIEKNKVIGSAAFQLSLDKVSALMKVTLKSENTEVYLIDGTGLLLSESEYIGINNKKGVLIQEVKSDGAKNCLEWLEKHPNGETIEKHEEEIIRYKNYMGDEVYGVYSYVPAIEGCVIAEKGVDAIESFSLITMLEYFFKGGKNEN